MKSSTQPIAESGKRSGLFSRLTLGFVGAVMIYVLSFGPVQRLTVTVIDGTDGNVHVIRRPPFPSLSSWTTDVYRPLYYVLMGRAGEQPEKILNWYVNLWG